MLQRDNSVNEAPVKEHPAFQRTRTVIIVTREGDHCLKEGIHILPGQGGAAAGQLRLDHAPPWLRHRMKSASGQRIDKRRFPTARAAGNDDEILHRTSSVNWNENRIRRPVSRVLFPMLPWFGSHSSGRAVTSPLTRHTRSAGGRQPVRAPYLVLLQAGFTMPGLSPGPRWALTPPFHPYPETGAVCFLWHFPSAFAGRPLAVALSPWSPDFPPIRRYQRISGCPTV